MDKSTREFIEARTKELMNAGSCCKEAKEAAQNWLDSVGTDKEDEATRSYVSELKDDIIPVEGLIAFADSSKAKAIMGAEGAKALHAHGEEVKAAGGKYCDCDACKAAEAIVERIGKEY